MQLCENETDFESILGEGTPIFVYFKGASALFYLDTQVTTDHTRGRRPDGWQDWRRPGDDPPPTPLRPSKGSGVAQCCGGQDQGRARGSGVGQSQPGGAASNGRERSEGKYYWEDQRSHQARVDLAAFRQHPKTSFDQGRHRALCLKTKAWSFNPDAYTYSTWKSTSRMSQTLLVAVNFASKSYLMRRLFL